MKSRDESANTKDGHGRLRENEAAQRLGLAVTTLQKWRQRGIGPKFLKFSARVFYPIESIEAFERDALRTSTSEKAERSAP